METNEMSRGGKGSTSTGRMTKTSTTMRGNKSTVPDETGISEMMKKAKGTLIRSSETLRTKKEILDDFGPTIGPIVFDTLPEVCKEIIEAKESKGYDGDLWINPSDILDEKLILTPPVTRKHVQALTHQGILGLGERYLEKLKYEAEKMRDEAVANREQQLIKLAEIERGVAVEEAIRLEKRKCGETLKILKRCYEERLQEAVKQTEERLERIMERKLAQERALWEAEMEKMKDEYGDTGIQGDCRAKLEEMSLNYEEQLQETIRQHEEEKEAQRQQAAKEKEECLFKLLTAMRKQQERDLLYMSQKQLLHCEEEKEVLQVSFNKQVDLLLIYLYEYENVLKEKISDIAALKGQSQNFEYLLYQVTCEFQKFIDYALKAVPGQADFLLKSVQQMLKGLRVPEPPPAKSIPTARDEKRALVRVNSYLNVLSKHPSLLSFVAPFGVGMPDIKPPRPEDIYEELPPLPDDQPPVYPEKQSLAESIFSELFHRAFSLEKRISKLPEGTSGEVSERLLSTLQMSTRKVEDSRGISHVESEILREITYTTTQSGSQRESREPSLHETKGPSQRESKVPSRKTSKVPSIEESMPSGNEQFTSNGVTATPTLASEEPPLTEEEPQLIEE